MNTVIIMAGGTGGHIYPALALGVALQDRGVNVFWMGVRHGLEEQLAAKSGFEFDSVRIRGVWGKGIIHWLTMPVWLIAAIFQCVGIILRRRPDALVGMGGYVCAPGGVASWLLRRPLVIHESNSVVGLTNRILARLATRALTGFSDTRLGAKPIHVGTPVRAEIISAADLKPAFDENEDRRLRLLVIGGSQGAQALNKSLPEALKSLPDDLRPETMHQIGSGRHAQVIKAYEMVGISADVREYIDDMAAAYTWADFVVARAGAMTIAEISVMGLAAILVPFPYAARDHQRVNAEFLGQRQGAIVCIENENLPERIAVELTRLAGNRSLIKELSGRIRSLARRDATEQVASQCMNVMRV